MLFYFCFLNVFFPHSCLTTLAALTGQILVMKNIVMYT